jgi:hypothetical protein
MECGAKKRKGGICRAPAMANGRCYFHGGKSLKGAAHPGFKHGRFSKHMPDQLAGIFAEVQSNPKYITLERNLMLNEAFIREKLETLKENGNPAEGWDEVVAWCEKLHIGIANLNMPTIEVATAAIEKIADEQTRYHQMVAEIQKTMAEQRKDLTAKSQIENRAEKSISAPELMALIGGIVHIINQAVKEPKVKYAIADGIGQLISVPGVATPVRPAETVGN